jgi:hypothetical protein
MDSDNRRIIELLPTDWGPTTITLKALILNYCADNYDYMRTLEFILML